MGNLEFFEKEKVLFLALYCNALMDCDYSFEELEGNLIWLLNVDGFNETTKFGIHKSLKDCDGNPYNGLFSVGLKTKNKSYIFYIEEKYFHLFKIPEVDKTIINPNSDNMGESLEELI